MVLRFSFIRRIRMSIMLHLHDHTQFVAACDRWRPIIDSFRESIQPLEYRVKRIIRSFLDERERKRFTEDLLQSRLNSIGLVEVYGSETNHFGGDLKKERILYETAERELQRIKYELCENQMWWIKSSLLTRHLHRGHRTPCMQIWIRDSNYCFIPSKYINN